MRNFKETSNAQKSHQNDGEMLQIMLHLGEIEIHEPSLQELFAENIEEMQNASAVIAKILGDIH